MNNLRSLSLCVLASVFFVSVAATAQQVAPAARIVNPIDESQLVTLTHTVHPLANAANDRGAAPDGMQLDRLQLVLQRSPAQESALHQLIAQMNVPGSASYHQWLTPDQFGAQFGASDQDIATIETWLGNHGFSISKVNPGKGTLEFSGSVGQLRDTFHTQIHTYVVDGQTHYANANDPSIPAALAPVIGGFTSLNNFHPRSFIKKLGQASFNPSTHQVTPQWTYGNSSGVNYVLAPGDFAVQYDLNPLYSAGVNGTGQSIAIINDSNVNIDLVNQFRTLFGLSANPPQVIIDGNDPGVDGINNPDGPNYDSGEAYLDVEWSGAVAPSATVYLVIAADTALEQGLYLAIEHAVYGNVAPVLSLSFGACEAYLGSTNSFINNIWEQAAAQGQTVMVSSGDNGSAGCDDDDTQEYAVNGQAVSGFASTPYNVAVGGTDFYYSSYNAGTTALGTQLATYWSATATQAPAVSILGYIPEQPWNDSQYGLNAINLYTQSQTTSIAGGSGGASNAAVCSNNTYSASTGECTGTMSGYPKPSWQTGAAVPADGVRDVPDVSLYAANGLNYSFYPTCAVDGDCQAASGSNLVQLSGVGGTSASAPAFAGIMALVNQKYGRQGQADNILYALKTQYPSAFHDVTNGTNSVPCEYAPTVTPNCIGISTTVVPITTSSGSVVDITEGQIGTGSTPEYNAVAGYSLATGLGTIDANNLVTNWGNVHLATSGTTLTATPTSITHGSAVAVSGTVTGTSPTGNVALMSDSTEPIQQGQGLASTLNGTPGTFALTSGAYSGSVTTLPGGSYNIWASYGGDNHNAASVSTKIPVVVNPENSGVFLQAISPSGTATGGTTVSTAIDYGTQLNLSAQVAPSSQLSAVETCTTTCPVFTIPTGQITFADSSNPINTAVINAEGDAEFNAPFAVGSHAVTASFAGDKSYNAATSSAITFTVQKDTPTLELSASALTTSSSGQTEGILGPNQPLVFSVLVLNTAQANANANSSSGAVYPVPVAPPTGTVTASGFPSGVTGTATLVPMVDPANQGGTQAVAGIANFTIPAGTSSGTYNVTFSYGGDSNYNAVAASSANEYSIPVVNTSGDSEQTPTIAATMTGSISPNSSITIAGTVTGTSGHPAPTSSNSAGTGILVYSSGYYINEVLFSSSSGTTSNFSFTLDSQSLIQGSNLITLQYTGDSVYNPVAITLNSGNAISSSLSDFTLVPDTTIVPVTAGNSGTDTVNVSSVNSFSGTVNLSCTAAAGVGCSISPTAGLSSGGATTATLTITAPTDTANQSYNVLVTGKDASTGEFIHTLGIRAVVTGSTAGAQSFAVGNGGNLSLDAGINTNNTSTITVTPLGGFTGTVNLACSVAPPSGATSPATCAIPASVAISGTAAQTATLTITTTSTTTAGNYTVTVTATGTNSSSTALTVTTQIVAGVGTPTFAMANSGALTIATTGATTGNTATITVTPTAGFTGTVNLSCVLASSPSGANDPATCTIPGSVSITGSTAQTATLTIATTGATADLVYPKFGDGKGWLGAGSGAVLAVIFFFGIPARRRSWRSMLGILVAMVALGALTSCGGGGSSGSTGGGGGGTSNPGTTTGTYTFTVTGTSGSGSTAITQTTTVTVNVQ